MKHRIAAALVCACIIPLAGCANAPPGTGSAIDAAVGNANAAATSAIPTLAKIEAKVSAALVKACGWEPTLSTAANLAATVSASATASTLASVITGLASAACGLLRAPASNGVGLLDRAPVPTLRGVPLVGKFVR